MAKKLAIMSFLLGDLAIVMNNTSKLSINNNTYQTVLLQNLENRFIPPDLIYYKNLARNNSAPIVLPISLKKVAQGTNPVRP